MAYLFPSIPNRLYSDDFFPRWYATKMLLTTGRSLYDWANAYEAVDYVGWPLAFDLRFYYPANLLFLTLPLSFLPYLPAILIWRFAGLWCLWLGIAIFARLFPHGLSVNRLTTLLVLMTTSVPVLQHTLFAQFNTIGVLALALTYFLLCRRSYLLAGLVASGLLFKPQVTALPLFILLAWTGLGRERRAFWPGLAGMALLMWAIPELLEPHWLTTFWQSLVSYPPVQSAIDRVWNPYQLVSGALVLLSLWFTLRLRHYPASSVRVSALLAWTICLTALIIPIYAMINIVLMGPVFVILLNGYTIYYPAYARWFWWGIIGVFLAGLAAFVTPLLLAGPTGLQIVGAEAVYRFTLPALLALASLPLMFNWSAVPEPVLAA
jgi:hypothetical protein